jgi:hypothetical protein
MAARNRRKTKSGFPRNELFLRHPEIPALRMARINASSVEVLPRERIRDIA